MSEAYISNLPLDILHYMLKFMSPSSLYILTTYFKLFRINEKQIFIKGVIATDACRYNNNELINLLINSNIYVNNSKISQIAAFYGSINILKEHYRLDEMTFYNACSHGDIDTLNWLKEKLNGTVAWNINKFKNADNIAALYNKDKVIRWLHNNDFHLKRRVWTRFINIGNLEILKWLFDQGYEIDNIISCRFTLQNFDIFKWLNNINPDFIKNQRIYLIEFDLESIKWFYDRGHKFINPVLVKAIQFNQLETLEWLYQHGYPLIKFCYFAAIKNHNKAIISWLYANNCPVIEDIYCYLIHHVDLDFLKWCHELGLQVHSSAYIAAVNCQKLDILKWLYSIRTPWMNFTFAKAIEVGNQEIIQWLKTVNCPINKYTICAAVRIDNLDLIKSLRKDGIPWSATAIKIAVKINNLSLIKWLYSNGCPLDKKSNIYACKNGNLTILSWLHDNNCPWDPIAAEECCRHFHYEILKYLILHNYAINVYNCLNILAKNKLILTIKIKNSVDMKTDKILLLDKIVTMINCLNAL